MCCIFERKYRSNLAPVIERFFKDNPQQFWEELNKLCPKKEDKYQWSVIEAVMI